MSTSSSHRSLQQPLTPKIALSTPRAGRSARQPTSAEADKFLSHLEEGRGTSYTFSTPVDRTMANPIASNSAEIDARNPRRVVFEHPPPVAHSSPTRRPVTPWSRAEAAEREYRAYWGLDEEREENIGPVDTHEGHPKVSQHQSDPSSPVPSGRKWNDRTPQRHPQTRHHEGWCYPLDLGQVAPFCSPCSESHRPLSHWTYPL